MVAVHQRAAALGRSPDVAEAVGEGAVVADRRVEGRRVRHEWVWTKNEEEGSNDMILRLGLFCNFIKLGEQSGINLQGLKNWNL